MKIPLSPPKRDKVLQNAGTNEYVCLFGIPPLQERRYLHRDELRHRTQPEGLTPELWWAGIKLARQGIRIEIALRDKHDRPVVLAMPDPVLRAVSHREAKLLQ